jgi:hypothetical protein
MLMPLDRMQQRLDLARNDSDAHLFQVLLYAGEMLTKMIVSGLVAALEDDRERHRYRLCHRLVRANGVGEWSDFLDDLLTGPSSQLLPVGVQADRTALTMRCQEGAWQYEAVLAMHQCLSAMSPDAGLLTTKVQGRQWFGLFAQLRNATRGHGAQHATAYGEACPHLQNAISHMVLNLPLLDRPWAYLHRNLSGRYRVTPWSADSAPFEELKTARALDIPNLTDGVYVYIGNARLCHVELMHSDSEALDYMLPNGGFDDRQYELISYISGDTSKVDAAAYLSAPGPLLAATRRERGHLMSTEGHSETCLLSRMDTCNDQTLNESCWACSKIGGTRWLHSSEGVASARRGWPSPCYIDLRRPMTSTQSSGSVPVT